MNSSIFNFEWPSAPGADTLSWRRFALTTVVGAVALMAAAILLLALSDPYDTGRFSLMPDIGVNDGGPRTADASRGRDKNFNAAIIGNSRGQLLDPRRLSAATGSSFVQLTVPGTGPREQLVMLRWFARHHASIGALALVADQSWCTPDPSLPIINDFPFWLYADSDLEYLKGLIRSQSFSRAWRRIRLATGRIERSDPAGYWDYQTEMRGTRDPAKLERPFTLQNDGVPADAPLPAIERLRDALAELPSNTPVVILMPPAYHTGLPAPGSVGAARLARCKAALADLAASRPRTALLDFFVDGDIARKADNFLDHIHYIGNVARVLEDAVAEKLR